MLHMVEAEAVPAVLLVAVRATAWQVAIWLFLSLRSPVFPRPQVSQTDQGLTSEISSINL